MESKTEIVRARIDKETKESAEEILSEVGLTMSASIRLFLNEVVRQNGLPFNLKIKK